MIDPNQTFVSDQRSRSNIGQGIGQPYANNIISPVHATNGFNLFNTTVASNGPNTMKNA